MLDANLAHDIAEHRVSICEFTTYHASLEEDLEAYAAAGAAGIGVCEAKLLDHGMSSVVDRVLASGLAVTHCIPNVPSILPGRLLAGPRDPSERVTALCHSIERLAALGPVACLCLTGPQGDLHPREAHQYVVEGLRRAARVAEACGVMLGLEPCNREYAREWSLVDSIEATISLLDAVESESIGLFVDLWHVWDSTTFEVDARRYSNRVIGVHVGDRRAPTRALWDRVMPGDGVADLGAMIRALEAGGYAGWYDIEVFSDDGVFGDRFDDSLWLLTPDEAARRAVEGFRAVLTEDVAD